MEYLLGEAYVTRRFEALDVGSPSDDEEPSPDRQPVEPRASSRLTSVGRAATGLSDGATPNERPLAMAIHSPPDAMRGGGGDSSGGGSPPHPGPWPTAGAGAEPFARRATATPSLSETREYPAPTESATVAQPRAATPLPPMAPSSRTGTRLSHHRPGDLPTLAVPSHLALTTLGADRGDLLSPDARPQPTLPASLEYSVPSQTLLGKYVLLYLPPPRSSADLEVEFRAYSGTAATPAAPLRAQAATGTSLSQSSLAASASPARSLSRARSPPPHEGPMAGFGARTSPRPGQPWGLPSGTSPPPTAKSLSRSLAAGSSHYGSPDISAAVSVQEDGPTSPLAAVIGQPRQLATATQHRLLAFYCLLLQQLKHEADRQRRREGPLQPQGTAVRSGSRSDSTTAKNAMNNAYLSEGTATTTAASTTMSHIRRHATRNLVEAPVAVLEVHYARPVPPRFAYAMEVAVGRHGNTASTGAAGGAGANASTAAHAPGGPLSASTSRSGSVSMPLGVSASTAARHASGPGNSVSYNSVDELPLHLRTSLNEAHSLQQQLFHAGPSSPPVAPAPSHEQVQDILELLGEGRLETVELPDAVVFDRSITTNPFYGGWMSVESADAYRRIIQQCGVYRWPAVVLMDPAGNVLTTMGLDHIEAELDKYVYEVLRPQQERARLRHQLQVQSTLKQQQLQQNLAAKGAQREGSHGGSEEGFDLTIRTRLTQQSTSQADGTAESVDRRQSSDSRNATLHDGSLSSAVMPDAASGSAASPSPSVCRESDAPHHDGERSPSHSVSAEGGEAAARRAGLSPSLPAGDAATAAPTSPAEKKGVPLQTTVAGADASSRQQSVRTELREASSVSVNDPQVPTAEPTPVKGRARQSSVRTRAATSGEGALGEEESEMEGSTSGDVRDSQVNSQGYPTTARYRDPATPTRTPLSLTRSPKTDAVVAASAATPKGSHGPSSLPAWSTPTKRDRAAAPLASAEGDGAFPEGTNVLPNSGSQTQKGPEMDFTVGGEGRESPSWAPPQQQEGLPQAFTLDEPAPLPVELPPFTSLFPWNRLVATAEMLSADSPRDVATALLQPVDGAEAAHDGPLPPQQYSGSSLSNGSPCPCPDVVAKEAASHVSEDLTLTLTATEGNVFRATSPLAVSGPGVKVHPIRRLASLALRASDILAALENADLDASAPDRSDGKARRPHHGSHRSPRCGRESKHRARGGEEAAGNLKAFSPSPQRQDGAVPLDSEGEGSHSPFNATTKESHGDSSGNECRTGRNHGNHPHPSGTHHADAGTKHNGDSGTIDDEDGDGVDEKGLTWQQRASLTFGSSTTHLICFFGAGWHPSTGRTVKSLRRLVDSVNERSQRLQAKLTKKVRKERAGAGSRTAEEKGSGGLDVSLNNKFTALLSQGGIDLTRDVDSAGCGQRDESPHEDASPALGNGGLNSLENDSILAGIGGGGDGGLGGFAGRFGGPGVFNGFPNNSGSSDDDADSQASEDEGRNCSVKVVYMSFDEDVDSLARTLRLMPHDWLCLTPLRLPSSLERGRVSVTRQLVMDLTRSTHEVDCFPRLVVLELPTATVALRRIRQYSSIQPTEDAAAGRNVETAKEREGAAAAADTSSERPDAGADVVGVFDFDESAYEGIWRVPQDRAELKLSSDPTGKHFPWSEDPAHRSGRSLVELTRTGFAAKGAQRHMRDSTYLKTDVAGELPAQSSASALAGREEGTSAGVLSIWQPRFPPVRPFTTQDRGLPVLLERGGFFVVLCAMGAVDAKVHRQCLEALDAARAWLYEEVERRKSELWGGSPATPAAGGATAEAAADGLAGTSSSALLPASLAGTTHTVPSLFLADGLRPSQSMSSPLPLPFGLPTSTGTSSTSTSAAASPRLPASAGTGLFSLGNTLTNAVSASEGALPALPIGRSTPGHISLPSVYFFDAIFGQGDDSVEDDVPQTGLGGTSAHGRGRRSRSPAGTHQKLDNTEDIRDEHRADLSLLQEYIIAPILEQGERQLAVREGEVFLACVRLPDRTTAVLRRKLPSELPPPAGATGTNAVVSPGNPNPGHSAAAPSNGTSSASTTAPTPLGRGPFTATAEVIKPSSKEEGEAASVEGEAPEELEVMDPYVASPSGRVPTAAPVSAGGPGGFPTDAFPTTGDVAAPPGGTTSLSNTMRTEASAAEREDLPDPNATPVASAEAVKQFLSEQILSLLYPH